jgi:hypothetical protein
MATEGGRATPPRTLAGVPDRTGVPEEPGRGEGEEGRWGAGEPEAPHLGGGRKTRSPEEGGWLPLTSSSDSKAKPFHAFGPLLSRHVSTCQHS